jgi:hypothetical protein
MKNGDYVLPGTEKNPDATEKIISVGDLGKEEDGGKKVKVAGIVVNNVFFWKAPLSPGKNTVEVRDARGNSQSMVIYQKADDLPVPEDSLVVDLKSSNPGNPALFIDRPIEAQGPFYYDVDGSSDNTFDALPKELEGACWIATKRLSDEANQTDLAFTVTKPATVCVMYSTGTFPLHTLDKPDNAVMNAAAALKRDLARDGFADTGIAGTWRRHSLWLADFGLMSREVKAGETVQIPGQTLDYVVLVKPL